MDSPSTLPADWFRKFWPALASRDLFKFTNRPDDVGLSVEAAYANSGFETFVPARSVEALVRWYLSGLNARRARKGGTRLSDVFQEDVLDAAEKLCPALVRRKWVR